MDNIEKYRGELIERISPDYEMPVEPGSGSTSDLIVAVLRRWYIVVLVFLAMCMIGIPAIWLLIEPRYAVTGAIRVAPILSNILTGEADILNETIIRSHCSYGLKHIQIHFKRRLLFQSLA